MSHSSPADGDENFWMGKEIEMEFVLRISMRLSMRFALVFVDAHSKKRTWREHHVSMGVYI
jgi:hypothetical protein